MESCLAMSTGRERSLTARWLPASRVGAGVRLLLAALALVTCDACVGRAPDAPVDVAEPLRVADAGPDSAARRATDGSQRAGPDGALGAGADANDGAEPDAAPDSTGLAGQDAAWGATQGRVQIHLRWAPAYPGDSHTRVAQGVRWVLSLLGAQVPPESKGAVVTWLSPQVFRLDLSAAGFPAHAMPPLRHVCDLLRASGEFSARGSVDVGRFVMLTLNTSAHYYAVTGMPATWQAFHALHGPLVHEAHVLKSLVAYGQRRLRGVAAQSGADIAWVAEEGPGDLRAGTFAWHEREVIDVMANGQLRFGVYDVSGQLRPWADPQHSAAGKPTRCMFCHESGVEPMWLPGAAGGGGMSQAAFNKLQSDQRWLLSDLRATRPSLLRYDIADEHSQGELLYVAFAEPTAARLAAEWGLPLPDTLLRLKGLETHHELVYHAWTAPSYDRRQVDLVSPYGVVRVPTHATLQSSYEPDLLGN